MGVLETAKRVIQDEIHAAEKLLERLDEQFVKAVDLILNCKGKVVVTGLGKTGHIGRKIAASLASTGTPAFFVHADEALHGDSGMIEEKDVVIAISNSGQTAELLACLQIVKRTGSKIIAMTGKVDSSLAKMSDVVLNVGVEREADTLNLAPTSSTTATLIMGDALVVALMEQRGFSRADFGRFHPGGALGASLKGETV